MYARKRVNNKVAVMKLILMYTIEDNAHRDALRRSLDDIFGEFDEYSMLDQSTYSIPGESHIRVKHVLQSICLDICDNYGKFSKYDEVTLYYAKNPKDYTSSLCDISRIDILDGLRRRY